jgi:hypothetical protein
MMEADHPVQALYLIITHGSFDICAQPLVSERDYSQCSCSLTARTLGEDKLVLFGPIGIVSIAEKLGVFFFFRLASTRLLLFPPTPPTKVSSSARAAMMGYDKQRRTLPLVFAYPASRSKPFPTLQASPRTPDRALSKNDNGYQPSAPVEDGTPVTKKCNGKRPLSSQK